MSSTVTTPSTTTLVISFSGTLNKLVRGSVKVGDIDDAVFYLGCTREFTDDPTPWVNEIWGNLNQHRNRLADEVQEALSDALAEADRNGRVAWREPGQPNTWEALNELLESQGLPTIVPVDNDVPQTNRYCYPAVVQAVQEQNLPYVVIW